MHILLYGPPGSGKSTLATSLAEHLKRPLVDLDNVIEQHASMNISSIFQQKSEAAFRSMESEMLTQCLASSEETVISLGGGALIDPENRALAEQNGEILCLTASPDILTARLKASNINRPLLNGDLEHRTLALMEKRKSHYNSFDNILDTSSMDTVQTHWQAQVRLGAFRITGMGTNCDLRIQPGSLKDLGTALRRAELNGPILLVSDDNVAALYGQQAQDSLKNAGYTVSSINISPGETHKHIGSVARIWEACANTGLERGSTIVALGGGVVGDQAGFAAATYLRGISWVNVPTTLLAMVDSSLGGKTGANLPQGKNLIGAFHAPRLVLTDPELLNTLPEREMLSGLGETVKHGIIADPQLFKLCAAGRDFIQQNIVHIVRQSTAVKIRIIEEDPYERGLRQSLNLGHTIGHGIELACGFTISHGESVAIGTVAEARLAEHLGLAQTGLADQIMEVLSNLGLLIQIPQDIDRHMIIQAMKHDKKSANRIVRFALPVKIGEVHVGTIAPNWDTWLLNLKDREE
jgi:shikimate kinase / 3-dehydroquinate synthase